MSESSSVETTSSKNPPKKGKPTPRRKDVERARGVRSGPVAPAPQTRKEAKLRRKTATASLTKDEKRAAKARNKDAAKERREAMMDGDQKYLLARDRGPVRKYIRDWVDSRRRLLNIFMPLAFAVIIVQLLPNPSALFIGQIVFMVVLITMVADGVFMGFQINRAVRDRFDEPGKTGFGLGWYAVMRATQLRSLRTPRPKVKPGDNI